MHPLLADVPDTPTGGAELTLQLMGRALVRQGASVHYIVCGKPGEKDWTTSDGMNVMPAISHPIGVKFIRGIKPLASTIKAMRMVNADVYYTWGVHRTPIWAGWHCKRHHIPLAFGIMHDWDVDGTRENQLNPIERKLYRSVIGYAQGVYGQTNHQLDLLRKHHGRDGDLVRNFCIVPKDANAETERDVIVWAASIQDKKRPEWFVELARRLPNLNFLMIGGKFVNHPGLYDRIWAQAQELPNLEMTGQLTFEQTAEHFKHALMHVLTSTSEGFPNVLLDAWKSGTPSVSTFDPDGIITSNGLGYACNTLDDIVEKVRSLAHDHQARITMGMRAIEYVRENHDPDILAARVLTMFQKYCAR